MIYHFLPAAPFGSLAVAVSELYRADAGWRRTLAAEYVILAALAVAFFYPFSAFVGLDPHDIEPRLWLPSWRKSWPKSASQRKRPIAPVP